MMLSFIECRIFIVRSLLASFVTAVGLYVADRGTVRRCISDQRLDRACDRRSGIPGRDFDWYVMYRTCCVTRVVISGD